MKASELRIGNWVKDENGSYQIKGEHLDEDNFPTIQTWEIPITEEWLLKFGFIHQHKTIIGQDFFQHLIDSEFTLYVNLNKMNISINKKYVGNVFSKKLQYVHQLQNLYFALTGEELFEIYKKENNESKN